MTEETHNQEEDIHPSLSLERVVAMEIFGQIKSSDFTGEFLKKLNSEDVKIEDWQRLTDLILAEKVDAEKTEKS